VANKSLVTKLAYKLELGLELGLELELELELKDTNKIIRVGTCWLDDLNLDE
jgi:hypothetical protein